MLKEQQNGSAKKGKETKRMKDAVNAYVKSSIEMWSKALGSENIMERKAVANKIKNGLALCFNNVYDRQPIIKIWVSQTMETVAWNKPAARYIEENK